MPSDEIREAALRLGYIDARPVTGHPFDLWRKRLSSLPLGKTLSFEHDPVNASGWPLDEITLWIAIAQTPPMADWPDGCGEISAFYLRSRLLETRREAWEDAAIAAGYEIKRNVTLPERAAAIRAGFGAHGLNGLMVTPDYGSFINITALLVHASPPSDARGPENDMSPGCGNCGLCIEACPTGAISENGVDAMLCLRYYISHPETMTEDDYPKMNRRIQGCETCQRVCPLNEALVPEQPPADMIECLKLENLLNSPDIECMSNYVNPIFIKEKTIKAQAALAAANTGRKDLARMVDAFIDGNQLDPVDSRDAAFIKMGKWASERLGKINQC